MRGGKSVKPEPLLVQLVRDMVENYRTVSLLVRSRYKPGPGEETSFRRLQNGIILALTSDVTIECQPTECRLIVRGGKTYFQWKETITVGPISEANYDLLRAFGLSVSVL